MIAMMLPAILLTGCDPGQEDILTDGDSAEVFLDDEQAEEDLTSDESDGVVEDDSTIPPEDESEDTDVVTADITGTYFGESTATETEYFRVKENLYFDKIKVGTAKDFMLTVVLDETTGKYYTNEVLAEKTEHPNGDIYLESIAEYEGSMSKESTLSLNFVRGGTEVKGTETDIVFVYGAIAAKEIWSITAQLSGDKE